MKFFKINYYKDYSIIFWVILISVISIFISTVYRENEKEQSKQIKESLKNIYLQKTIKEITNNLEPRYTTVNYISKSGDTYESIIDNLNIKKNEKKILLNTILREKSLKILKINQKFTFKFDHLSNLKISEFKIETDSKNEVIFYKSTNENIYLSKKIEKNFIKKLVYKETIITNSLYNSAINLGIKPNIIVEFARLYGFQVDFQRDIWKNDSFQIIYEEFLNDKNKVVDTGEIIFANLNLQNTDLPLYKYEYEKNKIDYFDESGKSIKKTLMKTPINGARLSSSYGKENIQY